MGLFEVLTFHRRSCTILQRSSEKDATISRKLHDLLNKEIPSDDGELADHDFDDVSQTGCDYADNGKGLQLDVEKILGSGTEEVGSVVVGLVEQVDELFSKKDKEREAIIFENLPMREEPRI